MPELPEVRQFAELVNETFKDTQFVEVRCQPQTDKQKSIRFNGMFSLEAESRGKQLKLTLIPIPEKDEENNSKSGISPYFGSYTARKVEEKSVTLIIGFGLTGYLHADLPNCTDYLLSFKTANSALNLISSNPESVYYHEGDFDAGRGPDMLDEFPAFKQRILTTNFGSRRLCEILMDERYFNGVGNYLRSEIIHRRRVPYNQPIIWFDEDFPEFVQNIVKEAFSLVATPEGFRDWLQCYGKAPNSVKDKNGRTVWFFHPTDQDVKRQVIQPAKMDENEAMRFTQSLMMQ